MKRSKIFLALSSGLLAVVAMAASKSHKVPTTLSGSIKGSGSSCVHFSGSITAVTGGASGHGVTARTGNAVGNKTVYLSKPGSHCVVTLFTKASLGE